MLIKFVRLNEEDGEIECLKVEVIGGEYSEYVKVLKVVDNIVINEITYKLENIELVPAEDECFVACIDVYIQKA